MQCPVDQTVLQMTDRQGIEIDYCPTCRGVWLDRGELDKIIERDAAATGAAAPRQDPPATAPTPAAPVPPPVAAPSPMPYESVGYPQQQQRYRYGSPGSPDSPDYRHGGYQQGHHRRRRKGGFLGDLFDFD